MIHDDPNDPMPDRMSWTITIAGYAFGIALTVLMFWLALPATSLG